MRGVCRVSFLIFGVLLISSSLFVVVPVFAAPGDLYEFVWKWGTEGSGNGQFSTPIGVAVDEPGNVYVADYNNGRIQKFASSGEFVLMWGGPGLDEGQFNHPTSVAVDQLGYVYVADMGNNRIQKFTSTGVYVSQWGSHGSGNGQFNYPYGVAVDGSGNVYVADYNNDRIQKFTSTGVYVTKWGVRGSGSGQFYSPSGVAIDRPGNVYVVDTYNRIQKFTSTGVYVTKWGVGGSGNGQFNSPRGVAVDEAGNVYVADANNDRIQIFDLVPGIPLGEAVDADLKWTTGGSKTWFGQTAISYYDGDAARSRSLNDDQYTYIHTSVTGPGTLSFYWKVSSEPNWDILEFYIDSTLQRGISGEVDWLQESYQIASGSHTLEWRYSKDSDTSVGMDAGWLDSVQYNPLYPASITVTSPDGEESWVRGTSHKITWILTGGPGAYVKIELLKAGVVNKVITTSTANDGNYDWTIPTTQTFGADYKIRITSTTYPSITDSSDANFAITTGSLTATSPNGGETWLRGTTHAITWTKSGSPGDYVKIELLKAGVLNQIIVASTANSGSYSWPILSTQTLGTDYKIRITSTTDPSITDSSDADFAITTAEELTVTSPNGGEDWVGGTTHEITWTSTGSPKAYVKIELLKGGVLNRVISSTTANDGSFLWTMPLTQTLGNDYRVRITRTTFTIGMTAPASDTSNGDFAIIAEELTVTSPNGGEGWVGGTTHEITWTSTGNPKAYVKIELMKPGMLNRVITSSTPNDGSFDWVIPMTYPLGSDYSVRITRTTFPAGSSTATDSSNAYFSLIPETLTVTSPNGGEDWVGGTAHAITWASTGNPKAYVRIELLKAGVLSRVISRATLNDGSFDWVIPMTQTLGSDYSVKITRTTYPIGGTAATDSSDSYFAILD